MNDPLTTALNIAIKAHEGQFDKGGVPYILHPIRIMLGMNTLEEKVVALLHDVVEDSPITHEELAGYGFSEDILDAVRRLTHLPDVSYDDYVTKILESPVARTVKLGDLRDNMNITRLSTVTDNDLERIKKYARIFKRISEFSDK
jgi:(p)ppGpp synthase/HD superfamily hydrolase